MENITVQKFPADQGMRQVIDMIKSKYIAELMDGNNGACRVFLTMGVNHCLYHKKPYYFSEKEVSNLQRVIVDVCTSLMKVRILQEPQSEAEYPLCYGDDMVSKFKVLGKVIKLPYLFINVLGKTKKWQSMHLFEKKESYYNRFTDAELDLINNGIRAIALKLRSIQLEYQVPPSAQ